MDQSVEEEVTLISRGTWCTNPARTQSAGRAYWSIGCPCVPVKAALSPLLHEYQITLALALKTTHRSIEVRALPLYLCVSMCNYSKLRHRISLLTLHWHRQCWHALPFWALAVISKYLTVNSWMLRTASWAFFCQSKSSFFRASIRLGPK